MPSWSWNPFSLGQRWDDLKWLKRVVTNVGGGSDGKDIAAVGVAIVDASGGHITSFGGGTQYTEGDTDATVTGTAVMWEDTSDTLRAASAAKPLPVNIVAGGAGDGAILDGVSSSIKGTVFDYTNANPVAVRLTDTNGDFAAAGGGTQYTEDAASAADPIGTQLIGRRRDALATETTTDGDNTAVNSTSKGELYVKHVDAIPITDNAGSITVDGTVALSAGSANIGDVDVLTVPAPLSTTGGGTEATALRVTVANDSTGVLSVDDNGSSLTVDAASLPLPTGASTLAEQQTQTTALQLIDDSVHADDAARGKSLLIGAVLDDAAPTAVTENQGGFLRMSSARRLLVDPSGVTSPVSGTVTLGAGSANVGDVDVLTVPAPLSTTGGGTEATALRVTIANDSTGVVSIDDNGGIITVDGTVSVNLNAGTATNEVVGDVAHDVAAAGNPVLIAARANANEPATQVADADSTYLWADTWGRLVVIPGHPSPEAPAAVNATASGNTTVVTTPGASLSLYICKASVHNRDASANVVSLTDGAGGTTRWRAELASEGGGSIIDFGDRGWKLTANTLLNVNLANAGDVDVNITSYYIAA